MVIEELSQSIKILAEHTIVTFMHSSLPDNVKSCLFRFDQLGLIKIQTYASNDEGRAEFVIVPENSRDSIHETLQYLLSVRPMS